MSSMCRQTDGRSDNSKTTCPQGHKNVVMFTMKAFAEDNLNVAHMMETVFARVYNIAGKRDKVGH